MADATSFPSSFVEPWKHLLASHNQDQLTDWPNHHVTNPDSLITTSIPRSLHIGTGQSIYQRALLPAILRARRSVHLVTCYWAVSPTLDALRETLLQLASSRAQSSERLPVLKVFIGFSSRGLLQKLFHTASRDGYVYPPSRWSTLGLPDEDALRNGGIEMTVKSIFFTPISVMHPKYVIVDGKRAFMPSCNVSWERWLEGCIEVEGDVVHRLLEFHARVWQNGKSSSDLRDQGHGYQLADQHQPGTTPPDEGIGTNTYPNDDTSATQSISFDSSTPVPTILLPSPHHRNPQFSFFFPFFSQQDPPMTPLNAALLTLFANAEQTISILTPNLTSQPVIDALLDALSRGVDVQIRTSRNMMMIEQLITCGTTTSRCLKYFISKYQTLLSQQEQHRHRDEGYDVEAQPARVGKLDISYYRTLQHRMDREDEPVLSHFKMTLVDGQYLVLGSGNMDRASWWTSQELGILLYVPGFDGHKLWDDVLEARTETVFRARL